MNVSAIFIHCIVIITLTPLLYAYSDDTRLGIQLSDGDTCQKTRSTRCIQCAQDCGVCAGDIDYYENTTNVKTSNDSSLFILNDVMQFFTVIKHICLIPTGWVFFEFFT